MSQTKNIGIIAGILSAVVLVSCGVRDTSEDNQNSTNTGTNSGTDNGTNGTDSSTNGAVTNSLGSDTSDIAGFWEPNFGGANQIYIVISEVGDWTYVREDSTANCYNIETNSVTKVTTNEYSLNDSGVITSLIAVISPSGQLEIDIISDNPSSAVYAPVESIMPQDLQLCGS